MRAETSYGVYFNVTVHGWAREWSHRLQHRHLQSIHIVFTAGIQIKQGKKKLEKEEKVERIE